MPDSRPRCAVIIPTYNGAGLTATCLTALLASPPVRCEWEIVVVDDGSSDGTAERLASFGSQITLVRQETNAGFARACNAGADAARPCQYLVFLNNDTLPVAGWLDALVDQAQEDERVAAVGARLLYPGGLVQHAGVVIGQDGWPHHLYAGFDGEHPAVNRPRDVPAVTAACMLVRREDFRQLDGFDVAFHNGYEDVDLCLRLGERGRLVRYCPRSVLYHLESVTRWPSGAPEGTEISERVYEERWRQATRPDDVEHYLEDGLLALSYGPHYPITMSVAPELAVVQRTGAELAGLERLLSERSRQVMELTAIQTREGLRAAAAASAPQTGRPSSPSIPVRLSAGREHALAGEARHLVSVVLPVKNSARFLEDLLPSLLAQTAPARIEIIAVDSGSTDDTIDVLGRFDATVLAIEPHQFDHGLTRNLGAEQAHGDVLVFLSHRSRPVGNRWLAPLLAALDEDPELAGVCSRVTPRPDADLLTQRDVERDLSASTERQRKHITDWSAYRRLSPEQLRVFINFHTVSTAIRAQAWKRTPFRSVRTLGEDLLWARETLESGWALLHEPASVVQHSHSYAVAELLARNVDDGIANRDIVGRSFARDQVLPLIRGLVADDWSYLDTCEGLSSAEREGWKLESMLRRGAQTVGQWVGVNYESLPAGTADHFSGMSRVRSQADLNGTAVSAAPAPANPSGD